ncbi:MULTISPECIES: ATP-binding protein [Xanthomonas]|uniref:histidine kinase n=1 Tax=Xanthomonas hortorum pv. hederae TaxID=453603 RepID=A0A9X4BT05_9XANT|nr:ATP-binding protein [Xanthomonas hortorum]MBG3851059.1 HAMP domain-containing histidine kinase [Xanthomonas hortorum pv. carotae]MDC8639005.1 ATP-binding protein [Xanthomonas hortorum pv. hederae]UTS71966.1 ATP-binding protein [Xanthomonas hortorum]
MNSSDASFLRTLCSLRWLATAGQAATILVATGVMGLNLPQQPLWAGVAALAVFNLYAQLRVAHRGAVSQATEFGHILVDVTVLTWMVGWSGGIANPFGSLFLVLIALAALALPLGWAMAVAASCVAGYVISAAFGLPLPYGSFDPLSLHMWGMAANFLLSTVVVLAFATRLALSMREREREISMLRERFARNEGIVALATHAASVAHELNTPLATMTLLVDDIADQCDQNELREDLDTLRELLVQCHERVLALAAPADNGHLSREVAVTDVLEQWRLVRPTIELRRNDDAPMRLLLQPGVSHLLMVLLNNAADAGERAGRPQIDLTLRIEQDHLSGEVRDYGPGFDTSQAMLPGTLFNSGKHDGMGVGLALSHATVERLQGELWMLPAEGSGARVGFRLPLSEHEALA